MFESDLQVHRCHQQVTNFTGSMLRIISDKQLLPISEDMVFKVTLGYHQDLKY